MVLAALLSGALCMRPLEGQTSGVARPDLSDRGTFELSVAGKSIGTERFQIRVRSDQIEAQGDVLLRREENGKSIQLRTSSTLLLGSQFNPLSYTWNQKGAQSSELSIDFRAQPAEARYRTLNGQNERRNFKLEKGVVVLDDNVIHHYQLALAHYDQVKGGAQGFRAFIPQEALPGEINIIFMGDESVNIEWGKRMLRRFLLTTENAQISLWVDPEGRLQMMSAPGAQFQAVRKR
jgi:hypothetical protein